MENLFKKTTVFFLTLLWSVSLKAQVHSRNQRVIEFSTGLMDKISFKKEDNAGFWANLMISKYNSRNGGFRYGISFQQKYYKTPIQKFINCNQYLGDVGYGLALIKSKQRRLFFNGSGGVLVGYESINNEKKELDELLVIQNTSKILIGMYASAEVEAIINTKVSLLLNVRQLWTPTSDIQGLHSRLGMGIRLNYF